MNATYLKYEVIRTLRNRQGFIFSLAFPLVMFFLIAGPNKGEENFWPQQPWRVGPRP
jgi:ABC-2 type transport system permease protein